MPDPAPPLCACPTPETCREAGRCLVLECTNEPPPSDTEWQSVLTRVRAALQDWPALSITCPRCGRTSYHPKDIAEGYCGRCHDWTTGVPSGNRT